MPPDWMSLSISFLEAEKNSAAHMIVHRPQHRTHAIDIGAVTAKRTVPANAPRSTRAEKLGLKTSHLVSIKGAVEELMEYVTIHGIDPRKDKCMIKHRRGAL